MKRLLAAVLLLTVLVATGFRFKPQDPIAHTLASTVRIEAMTADEDAKPVICTGFMVAPRRAVTAAHCVPNDVGFTVDGEDALVLMRNPFFALISAGDKPSLQFANKLKIQEPVIAFGYAWGDMFVFGRQVATIKDGDFAMDGPLAPGMSGGPTVNQAGEVVGLNQAANNVIGIVCGAGEIQEFLSASPR